LVSTYTSNQTGAIATLLSGALWGLTTIGVAIDVVGLEWASLMVFAGLVLVIWMLIPLYVKRIKPAFIAGIVVMFIILTVSSPAFLRPLYTFVPLPAVSVYDISFGVFDLVGLAFIYFSYKSYKELK